MEIGHILANAGNHRIQNSEILKQIRQFKAGSEEVFMIAEKLLAAHRYFAAASLFAEHGMKEKALGIADQALKDRKGYAVDPKTMRMLVEVAGIYITFDEKYGRGNAHKIAQECERVTSHIFKSAHQERYGAAAGEIYSMLGMHLEAALMYEVALQNDCDWETRIRYLKGAIEAFRKMGGPHLARADELNEIAIKMFEDASNDP